MARNEPAVTIRQATVADAPLLAQLGAATFLETYAGLLNAEDIRVHCERHHCAEAWQHWLSDANSRSWLACAEEGGAPVGYLLMGLPDLPVADLQPSEREIKRLYLLHRFQGLGLGRQLLQQATLSARAGGCSRLLLGVYSENHAALNFYARVGFSRVGERTFHVGHSDFFDYILSLPL
jgi:ribosomal protein S18 acetylase RimI-like enzyme